MLQKMSNLKGVVVTNNLCIDYKSKRNYASAFDSVRRSLNVILTISSVMIATGFPFYETIIVSCESVSQTTLGGGNETRN